MSNGVELPRYSAVKLVPKPPGVWPFCRHADWRFLARLLEAEEEQASLPGRFYDTPQGTYFGLVKQSGGASEVGAKAMNFGVESAMLVAASDTSLLGNLAYIPPVTGEGWYHPPGSLNMIVERHLADYPAPRGAFTLITKKAEELGMPATGVDWEEMMGQMTARQAAVWKEQIGSEHPELKYWMDEGFFDEEKEK